MVWATLPMLVDLVRILTEATLWLPRPPRPRWPFRWSAPLPGFSALTDDQPPRDPAEGN